MSKTLISRSPALQQLLEEGYAIRVIDNAAGAFLLVDQVPYVNAARQVRRGTLVSPLEMGPADAAAAPVTNHQMWFIGEHPCHADGSTLTQIQHSTQRHDFGGGLIVDHGFSAMLHGKRKYADYHQKATQYITIISSPAEHLVPGVSARVHKPFIPNGTRSVFKYPDTATSRYRIGAASSRIAEQKIAIIGLGGTGSYVLDFVSRTHVAEIHLFDGDVYQNHSAFRSPGPTAPEELTEPQKVALYADRYGRMREGIFTHPYAVTAKTVSELAGLSFVFICIDNPEARQPIFDALVAMEIPFVDVGMALRETSDGKLIGQCRTTLATPTQHNHLATHVSFAQGQKNDLYAADIQVIEINALNAIMAVIKWKKLFGYYEDDRKEYHSVYTLPSQMLTKDEV